MSDNKKPWNDLKKWAITNAGLRAEAVILAKRILDALFSGKNVHADAFEIIGICDIREGDEFDPETGNGWELQLLIKRDGKKQEFWFPVWNTTFSVQEYIITEILSDGKTYIG